MHGLAAVVMGCLTLWNTEVPLQEEPNPQKHSTEVRGTSPDLGFRPELAPQEPPIEVQLGLKVLAGGGYFYKGSQQERFDAEIFPDGSVQFHEAGTFQFKVDTLCVGVFCPIATPRQPAAIQKPTRKDRLLGEAKRIATQVALGVLSSALPSAGQDASATGFPGNYNHRIINPTVRPSAPAVGFFRATGRFGYMPHLSQPKLDFLKKTADFRLALAVKARQARLRTALRRLQNSLRQIEFDSSRSFTQKRQDLLQLWSEFDVQDEDTEIRERFAQDLSDSLKAKIGFAKQQMRSFSQRLFPQGSPRQFSAAELAKFNHSRQGAARFVPYPKVIK